jgi:hypothetical protein
MSFRIDFIFYNVFFYNYGYFLDLFAIRALNYFQYFIIQEILLLNHEFFSFENYERRVNYRLIVSTFMIGTFANFLSFLSSFHTSHS